MLVWLLCAFLASLIVQAEQEELPLSIKDVTLDAEETYRSDGGQWVLIVEWKDEINESDQVSYDIEIFHTEQMRRVHFENIRVKPNETIYRWKWTSPIPLQCTSHSVRLRCRNNHNVSKWTSLYLYKGQDQIPSNFIVYPQDQVFMVGSNVTFCCILKRENALLVKSSDFLIRISNRTFITKPVHLSRPSEFQMHCDMDNGSVGSSVFVGYPPDDQNLRCVTRDLSSVECYWDRGRPTSLLGSKETKYILEGNKREYTFNQCKSLRMEEKVTNWTLIAKNLLGSKTLTDRDDPLRRVWLKAPHEISSSAYARNATIQWRWSLPAYRSFRMICEVMLNKSIYNEAFHGEGLESVVLEPLQPFTNYEAEIRCASDKYIYKWGDWSKITRFSTKEDIPEPVDVWIKYTEPNTCVLWKPLTQQQSHGRITGYELTLNNTSTVNVTGPDMMFYNFTSGNSIQRVTVSARNSAGLSPPSAIIVPHNPGVIISRIYSINGGFELFWRKSPYSICGYLVEWFQTYKKHCAVDWKKIPEWDGDARKSWNLSGNFEEGERYTISVYACTDHAPVLLQRHEGYAKEQRPLKSVQKLTGIQIGKKMALSWTEVPLDQQKGFILGYRIKVYRDSEMIINETEIKEHKVIKLDPGSYTIEVCAFTSVGDGENAKLTINMEITIEEIVAASVVGSVAATLVFIIITILCYRKRKWLKKLLYPDIPKPTLAGKFTTQGIYCTQMTEGYMKCDVQEVHSTDHPAISDNLHNPDLLSSKTNLISAQPFYQNTPSPVWPCAKKLASIIENPTYDLTIPEPVNVSQVSDSLLETQDSYLPAPNFVQPAWNSLQDSYPPAPQFEQPSPIIVEESYLPAPKFVQPSATIMEDSYLPAPKFVQPCDNFVDDSYLPAPQFVQPAFTFVQDSPNFNKNSELVKDSEDYKPQSALPRNV